MARDIGLDVPVTVMTNDPVAGEEFVERAGGQAVVKSITVAYWEAEDAASFVYANLVRDCEIPVGDRFARVPATLQPVVKSKRDVRVTVVGARAFSAIAEPTSALDWRLDPSVQWFAYSLPDEVERKCLALVQTFSLRFAGIDLLLDGEGTHWFLELNPNGEWGWLERSAGLPIASSLADEITGSRSDEPPR
jgi:glutathione synthase/RimK-type ligase-like ATP-grasp enzyme